MAVTDQSRYDLHRKLDAVLGTEEATTLMEHLPPVGWADVARRSDLDHLEGHLEGHLAEEIALVRAEMALLRSDILGQVQGMFNRLLLQLLAAQLAFVTVVLLVSGVA